MVRGRGVWHSLDPVDNALGFLSSVYLSSCQSVISQPRRFSQLNVWTLVTSYRGDELNKTCLIITQPTIYIYIVIK